MKILQARTLPFNSSILHVEGAPQDADEDEGPTAEAEASFWEGLLISGRTLQVRYSEILRNPWKNPFK